MHVKASNLTREIALKNNKNKISFYNQNGSLIEVHTYLSEDSISKLSKREVISFDTNDKPIRGNIYDENGQLKEYWIPLFDENDNIIEYKTFNSEERLIEIETFTYDANGNEIDHCFSDGSGQIKYGSKSKYNSKNQLIESHGYSTFGEFAVLRILTYNEEGKVVERTDKRADGRVTIMKHDYDEKNKVIRTRLYDIEGNLTHETLNEYIYDAHGNWITQVNSFDGKIIIVSERSIDYFE